MAARTLQTLLLTTAVALANLSAVRADPTPVPTEVLKDYEGRGIIQVNLPSSAPRMEDGKQVIEPGLKLWFPFRQAFVRPDRLLMDFELYGARQVALVQGNTERTYSPSTSYIVERSYRNVDPAAESPITTNRMSMVMYGKVLQELDGGRLLPAEDLEATKAADRARIEELKALRKSLSTSKNAEDVSKVEDAALESARVNDDLTQIEVRRNYPCYIMEYENKLLMSRMLIRGLVGDGAKGMLAGGKTRVWITKKEGLPIRIETCMADGRVVISFCFTELRINAGMLPGELTLGAPLATQTLAAVADLRDPHWQDRMEEDLAEQIDIREKQHTRDLGQKFGPRKMR